MWTVKLQRILFFIYFFLYKISDFCVLKDYHVVIPNRCFIFVVLVPGFEKVYIVTSIDNSNFLWGNRKLKLYVLLTSLIESDVNTRDKNSYNQNILYPSLATWKRRNIISIFIFYRMVVFINTVRTIIMFGIDGFSLTG
jgi:hypothetical protein